MRIQLLSETVDYPVFSDLSDVLWDPFCSSLGIFEGTPNSPTSSIHVRNYTKLRRNWSEMRYGKYRYKLTLSTISRCEGWLAQFILS